MFKGWTYSLDGNLINAPKMKGCELNTSDYGLVPIRTGKYLVIIITGWLYIIIIESIEFFIFVVYVINFFYIPAKEHGGPMYLLIST